MSPPEAWLSALLPVVSTVLCMYALLDWSIPVAQRRDRPEKDLFQHSIGRIPPNKARVAAGHCHLSRGKLSSRLCLAEDLLDEGFR